MRKRSKLFTPVTFFLIITFLCILFFKTNVGKGTAGVIQNIFHPIQNFVFHSVGGVNHLSEDSQVAKLKDENRKLMSQLVTINEIQRENQALRDQFNTTTISTKKLLPVNIIGQDTFVPGISQPKKMIIDKGEQDTIKVGQVVIFKDILVGKIINTSAHRSQVALLTNNDISITAKTVKTNALGVMHVDNGTMILDKVVLSDILTPSDIVATKGEEDSSGEGYPPDLVIGKIGSVDKKASNLFQSAQLQSILDITDLSTVFVLIKP